ncbi:exopolysaccharide biosynthesis protein [uncultured Microbulbifer sp.]|uniref:exopolysaccharide biosynthesis protein n=1 Tax=uncultured Microbulbifer sp. TaxID=348147 RepID=UPI0025EA8C1B|nr:exopolysaccharide biosynthesis protein [uncultured Microbulbifer sp.]
MPEEITNLTQLLFQLERLARTRDHISLEMVMQVVGRRSFAPILLLAGLLLFSPLSGIPGVPTLMGILVLLVTIQMLALRKHFWLPGWMLHRSIPQSKLLKTLHWLERPATVLDRWIKPRLEILATRVGSVVVALVCCAIALLLPLMEVVPFSASIAGLALATFGLAIIAHDGLLVLIAIVITGLVPGLIVNTFL